MKRSLIAVGIAVTFGAAATAQQQSQQPQQQPKQQPQQQEQQQQQPSASTQGQSIKLTGCVHQTTDQPGTFALQRTDAMSGSSAAGSGSTTGSSGTTGAAGTSGTSRSAAGGGEQGAWYRLSASATQDLKQYVGRAVQISGTVTPGKDEKGADVVIHRIEPGKVSVTALDLKPAPQLQVQSITAAQGQCSQGSGNR